MIWPSRYLSFGCGLLAGAGMHLLLMARTDWQAHVAHGLFLLGEAALLFACALAIKNLRITRKGRASDDKSTADAQEDS